MEKDKSKPKILNFCLEILAPFLTDKIMFIENKENNEEISYSLKNTSFSNSKDDVKGNAIPVVLMRNGFWMGCDFTFYRKQHNKKELKQLCLHFFDENNPLFRADWANADIQNSNKHAQPHWHFDTETSIKKQNNEVFDFPSFENYNNANLHNDDLTVDLGRVHFFMNWDIESEKDDSMIYLDFRDESLFKTWLEKTMQYINIELASLSKRSI